jgi:Arc/MetJ-type ribon-helix-helix transcriptional regulator
MDAMKIVLHVPEQLAARLKTQMERNGQSASEIIRQAMVESFDRRDSFFVDCSPLRPLSAERLALIEAARKRKDHD